MRVPYDWIRTYDGGNVITEHGIAVLKSVSGAGCNHGLRGRDSVAAYAEV